MGNPFESPNQTPHPVEHELTAEDRDVLQIIRTLDLNDDAALDALKQLLVDTALSRISPEKLEDDEVRSHIVDEAKRTFRRLIQQEVAHSKDTRTGLYTADAYFARTKHYTEQAVAEGCPLAIARIDLNGLKGVNDTFGHEAGDTYLELSGRIIQTSLQENGFDLSFAGRVGGDEFAIFFRGSDTERLEEAISNIRTQMPLTRFAAPGNPDKPDSNHRMIVLRAPSIGVAHWQPGDAFDPMTLDSLADQREREAKREYYARNPHLRKRSGDNDGHEAV